MPYLASIISGRAKAFCWSSLICCFLGSERPLLRTVKISKEESLDQELLEAVSARPNSVLVFGGIN